MRTREPSPGRRRPTRGIPATGGRGTAIHEEEALKRRLLAAALALSSISATAARAEDAADTAAVTRQELRGLLEGLNEQLQALQADTDKLKKFKFSGYVQARTEFSETSSDSVRVSSATGTITSPNLTRFHIRRARLKLTYDSSPLSQAVVYFDGGADRTIRLLEAYVTLLDPWTPGHVHQLTLGQFNIPFGYEIERSSSVRELPERSRAENVLFSGERDRGLKFESQWTTRLKTSIAMLNGGGVNSADFANTDPTKPKDLSARARWSQGAWDLAASGYWGTHVTPLTGPDVHTDKTRFGADAQAFWTLGGLGGGSLRGEVYTGHDVNPDSVAALVVAPTTANPNRLLRAGAHREHLATDMLGWYAMAVQNLGDRWQAVARYDVYDRNVDKDHDEFERWSLGLNAFYDGFTRLSVSYDVIRTDAAAGGGRFTDPHDNLWTIQLQHKF